MRVYLIFAVLTALFSVVLGCSQPPRESSEITSSECSECGGSGTIANASGESRPCPECSERQQQQDGGSGSSPDDRSSGSEEEDSSDTASGTNSPSSESEDSDDNDVGQSTDVNSGDSPGGAGDNRGVVANVSKEAGQLLESAERAAERGDYGKAYGLALRGHEQVCKYGVEDAQAERLTGVLLEKMRAYGERANLNGAESIQNKRFITK
jgi:hypothetical protein